MYNILNFQLAYLCSLLNYHTPTRSLHSANANLLSVPRVHTTFASCGFSIAAPQSGTHYPLAFAVLPLQTLSVASLKLTASSRPTAPPSGSAKCLRFGHWLTLCTLNIYLLTYALTYLLYSSVFALCCLFYGSCACVYCSFNICIELLLSSRPYCHLASRSVASRIFFC